MTFKGIFIYVFTNCIFTFINWFPNVGKKKYFSTSTLHLHLALERFGKSSKSIIQEKFGIFRKENQTLILLNNQVGHMVTTVTKPVSH